MRPAGRLHPIGSRPAGEPVSSDANGTRNRPPARVAGKRFSLRVSSRFASVYYRQAAPAGLVMITVMTAKLSVTVSQLRGVITTPAGTYPAISARFSAVTTATPYQGVGRESSSALRSSRAATWVRKPFNSRSICASAVFVCRSFR